LKKLTLEKHLETKQLSTNAGKTLTMLARGWAGETKNLAPEQAETFIYERDERVTREWNQNENKKRQEGWIESGPTSPLAMGILPQKPWTAIRAAITEVCKESMDQLLWLHARKPHPLEAQFTKALLQQGPGGKRPQETFKKLIALPGCFLLRSTGTPAVWDMKLLPTLFWDQICPGTQWIPEGPFKLVFRWANPTKPPLQITLPPKCKECGTSLPFSASINLSHIGNSLLKFCPEHLQQAGLSPMQTRDAYSQLWNDPPSKVWDPEDYYKWATWEAHPHVAWVQEWEEQGLLPRPPPLYIHTMDHGLPGGTVPQTLTSPASEHQEKPVDKPEGSPGKGQQRALNHPSPKRATILSSPWRGTPPRTANIHAVQGLLQHPFRGQQGPPIKKQRAAQP